MKNYNKPELNIERYITNSTIANDPISTTVGGKNYGANQTTNVGFDEWSKLFD